MHETTSDAGRNRPGRSTEPQGSTGSRWHERRPGAVGSGCAAGHAGRLGGVGSARILARRSADAPRRTGRGRAAGRREDGVGRLHPDGSGSGAGRGRQPHATGRVGRGGAAAAGKPCFGGSGHRFCRCGLGSTVRFGRRSDRVDAALHHLKVAPPAVARRPGRGASAGKLRRIKHLRRACGPTDYRWPQRPFEVAECGPAWGFHRPFRAAGAGPGRPA